MRKSFLIIIVLALIFTGYQVSYGQKVSYNYDQQRFNPYLNRISYSLGFGFSAYQGELSGFFDPSLQNYYLNPAGMIGAAYRFFDHLSLRGEINIFRLYSENVTYQEKNRQFSGINFDYSLHAVADIFPKGKIDGLFYQWDGHLFGGIGHVVFFPANNETGDRKTGVILNDTSSTDNFFEYARLSVIYPVGAGVKYYINKNHYISLEGIYRFTRSDFIDAYKDLSHSQFDKYFSLMFKYTVILDTSPRKTFEYSKYIKGRKKRIRE